MHPDAGATGKMPPLGVSAIAFFLARHRRIAYASTAGITVLTLAVVTRYVYHVITAPAALAVWCIGNATLLYCVYTLYRRGRFRHLPVATGRIVAIVPAHEQDTGDLHACIWSILNQRGAEVEEVHVVDDGSTRRPVEPFAHPRVRWHRTENGGRHAAAGYVLDRLEPDYWDFVLIADAHCLLGEQSLKHQLRAFSRPRVTATMPMVIARNAGPGTLTRIADLNIGAASTLPAVHLKIVSAAPVLYRAHLPLRYRRDDHRVAMYAASEGEVVGVSDAVTSTLAPSGTRTAYRQWLSWSTSWWRTLPLALTGPKPAGRLLALLHLIALPLAIGYAVVSVAISGWRDTVQWPAIVLYATLYLLVRYAVTGLYLLQRPATSARLRTWLLLTPVEAACNLAFVTPIKYIALAGLCRRGWRIRHDQDAVASVSPSTASRAQPGTVYYSGYLPDGHKS
jgi:hypothetical protein